MFDMVNGFDIATRRGRLSSFSISSKSAALIIALALVAACTGPHHTKQAGSKPGEVSNRGPLLAAVGGMWGQTRTRPELPIFSGGAAEISNTSNSPVRIISVRADHPVNMTLLGAGYITSMNKNGVGGFGGQTGDRTLKEAASSDRIDNRVADGWDSMRPLVGATIEPCCHHYYYLLLAYSPETSAGTGNINGVDITYRAGNGHIYQAFAAADSSFCTDESSSTQCDAESKIEGGLDNGAQNLNNARVMHKPDSWHD